MNKQYADFLASKAVRASERGLKKVPQLAPHLFPFQQHCVETHLRVSLKFGRCFFGIELKESYWREACKYLDAEERQGQLFDANDDIAKSVAEGFRAVKERVAAGGKGWPAE